MKVFYGKRDNMETIKTPYGKMQVVDEFVIQDDDKVTFCQKARDKYNELDKDGWFDSRSNEPYWYAFPYNRAKFTLCISKSLGKVCFIDYRKEDNLFESKEFLFECLLEARAFPHASGFGLSLYDDDDYEPTMINKVKYYPFSVEDDGEKYYFDKHGNSVKRIWNAISFGTREEALDFGNEHLIFGELDVEEVTKTEQVLDESKVDLFNSLLEAVEDFPKNTRAMYRFAKRRHDDTKAVRKASGQPYWVHPEGVAKIVMDHGGSDIEIKAAFCHDVLEDTGDSYEDLEEKFGEKVASIVKEVTNDKFEIARVGKEKYISEELCRLSPEALTVKLADMLYNMKDSPTESNYERMRKNIAFLMMNRQLDGIHLALAEEILEV